MVFGIASLVAVSCGLLVVYPYTIYLAILTRLPGRPVARRAGFAPGTTLGTTLVFCAYNEAQIIDQKIANIEMLKRRHPDLEVLAFDDGSNDSTYERLAARPDLVQVLRGGGRSGKAHGMKRLAAMAKGEIIIFTDANVMLDEEAIDNLHACYADPEVGGVCGSLHFYSERDASATAAVGSAYWRLEERIKDQESRTGSVMGADGSVFSIRRELYPSFPDTVLDDLTVSMAVVFAGKRLIKATDVIGREDIVVDRADEFARKIRISTRAFHTHQHLRRQLRRMGRLDRFKYSSRKLLRWFSGGALILGVLAGALACALVSPVLLGAYLAAGLAFIWIGQASERGPIAKVFEIVLALIATQIGVLNAMLGRTFQTWQPAQRRVPEAARKSGVTWE